MITAHFSAGKVVSNSTAAFSLFEKSRFGEKVRGKVEYSLFEALYLLWKGKLELLQSKKVLSFDQFFLRAKRLDKRVSVKFPVFARLRDRGYVLKTALKFGADFRVYKKGVRPGQDHALWVLFCVGESESHSWHEFAAKNRVAHSTRKKLLVGVVDDESDVTFFEVGWLKP